MTEPPHDPMAGASPEASTVPPGYGPVESRRDRVGRMARRTRMYLSAIIGSLALIYLVALVIANTDHVKVSWVFGSSRASLIWLIVIPAICGWLIGIATAVLFHRRTRRRF